MGTHTPSALAVAEDLVRHSSTNYHCSIWGDHFLSFSPDSRKVNAWQKEAASLKDKVREKLINLMETEAGLGEQLKMIDAIQRLGIAYHFEEEIAQALNRIFNNHHLQEVDDHDNLLISALRFRLLREHGYDASSDVLDKFKDSRNNFKEGHVRGLLGLYEASHLRVNGEDKLDEALAFATTKLQEMVPHLEPSLAKQVLHALSRPMRKALPRVYAREFMSFYQEDEVLLNFAKLDFNILQIQHQQELIVLSRWWKKLEVPMNFPFTRDRLVECYFWILGVYYEPQYALARKFLTKVLGMTSILDDFFDNVPGIQAELEIFTDAVQRWDINAMDKLPKYMKIWFQALHEVYDEMEEELTNTRRSFAVNYAKDAMIKAVKDYHEESKWLVEYQNKKVIPTMNEYTKTALDTSGYGMLTITSFVGMGEIATEQAFLWLIDRPQMLQAACHICRFMDDIVSHQFEQQREHVPSAVECYMHHEGVSEEEACRELNKQVENAWKDLNEAFLDPQSCLPVPLLMRILNLARVMDLLYKEEDGYTNPTNTKHLLISLLVDPLEL